LASQQLCFKVVYRSTPDLDMAQIRLGTKGSMYRVKSNGPSTEPCGTPYWTCDWYDTSYFTGTNW